MICKVIKKIFITFLLLNSFLTINAGFDTYKHALNILEKQNSRKFACLVIIADVTQNDYNSDPFKEKLFNLDFEESRYSYIFVQEEQNVSNVMQKVVKLSNNFEPSLIVVLDYNNSNFVQSVMTDISSKQFLENTWLMINPFKHKNLKEENKFVTDLQNKISDKLLFDTQLYILSGKLSSASLLEVFKTCYNYNLKITKVQELSKDMALNNKKLSLWGRRNNLMGCNLRIAYIDQPPFISKRKDSSKIRYTFEFGNQTFYGGNINQIELIEMLSKDLNFTTTWIPTKDNSYGVYDKETKEWNGLIGMIANGEADLSNAFFTVTSLRSHAITFTADIGILKFGLYMAKPSISPSWSTFVDVFNNSYWGSLLGGILVFTLALAIFSRVIDTKNRSKMSLNQISSSFLSSLSVVLLGMGACDLITTKIKFMCQSNAFKMLLFIICVLGLLNKEVYTGGLISSLVSKQFQSDIKTLEDFLKYPEYQLILRKGTASVQYFSEATQSPHREIWEHLLKDRTIAYIGEPGEAEKRIMDNPKEVYFDIVSQIEPSFENYPCKIIRADKTYFHRSFALGLKKNSPYLKSFNHKIEKYREHGVLDNMGALVRVRREDINCPTEHIDSVGYEIIFSAFIILGVGSICSLFYVMVELTSRRIIR